MPTNLNKWFTLQGKKKIRLATEVDKNNLTVLDSDSSVALTMNYKKEHLKCC